MPNIAARVTAIPEATGEAPWPGHEYVRGWGVFGLPFDSGHVLALRVFPQNPFAPYRTVWHRDPNGRWSIFADAPRLDIACPRYYGAACAHIGHARIDVSWTGPATLRVTVDEPSLDWTLRAHASPALAVLNAMSAAMPLASWRPAPLLRARERTAHALGLGRLALSGTMPSGHIGTLMPQRMYYIDHAHATLDGLDLGRPARLDQNPTIGDVPLPARGVLAIGQAMWQIRDPDEYHRTRTTTLARETR
jgi:hypothetical protein